MREAVSVCESGLHAFCFVSSWGGCLSDLHWICRESEPFYCIPCINSLRRNKGRYAGLSPLNVVERRWRRRGPCRCCAFLLPLLLHGGAGGHMAARERLYVGDSRGRACCT